MFPFLFDILHDIYKDRGAEPKEKTNIHVYYCMFLLINIVFLSTHLASADVASNTSKYISGVMLDSRGFPEINSKIDSACGDNGLCELHEIVGSLEYYIAFQDKRPIEALVAFLKIVELEDTICRFEECLSRYLDDRNLNFGKLDLVQIPCDENGCRFLFTGETLMTLAGERCHILLEGYAKKEHKASMWRFMYWLKPDSFCIFLRRER